MFDHRIPRRVPFLVIHSIEDAGERVLAVPQQTVETTAMLRRGNFARIAWTHRRN